MQGQTKEPSRAQTNVGRSFAKIRYAALTRFGSLDADGWWQSVGYSHRGGRRVQFLLWSASQESLQSKTQDPLIDRRRCDSAFPRQDSGCCAIRPHPKVLSFVIPNQPVPPPSESWSTSTAFIYDWGACSRREPASNERFVNNGFIPRSGVSLQRNRPIVAVQAPNLYAQVRSVCFSSGSRPT